MYNPYYRNRDLYYLISTKMNETSNFSKQKLLGFSIIGLSFILFICSYLIIVHFKLDYFKNQAKDKYKNCIIQTLIEDKHYCLALPTFLGFLIFVFYVKLVAFNYFKRS